MLHHCGLTDAHRELVDRTHRFAVDVVRPAAEFYDRHEQFPWPVIQEAAERGFYDLEFYARLLGDDTGRSLPLFMEELFWGCAGIGLSIVMPALALSALGRAATPEQLALWGPELFGRPGDLKLAALAVTEPSGGSDVRALCTRARRCRGDWVLDGHKIFIGNGGIADVHLVAATIDPSAGHRGQALFVVPKGTPGLEMVRKLHKLGCRASHTAELRLRGCRVPAECLLGGEERLAARLAKAQRAKAADGVGSPGDSGSATLSAFEHTRPAVAAQAVGVARAALEYATTYASQRRAFDRALLDHQGVAFPLADLAVEIDAARLLTWRASAMAAQGVPFSRAEGSMAKLKASEVAVRATEQALQTLGGWGYVGDHLTEKWYRDAKLYTIFEGTSEIQRVIVSRRLAHPSNAPAPALAPAPSVVSAAAPTTPTAPAELAVAP